MNPELISNFEQAIDVVNLLGYWVFFSVAIFVLMHKFVMYLKFVVSWSESSPLTLYFWH